MKSRPAKEGLAANVKIRSAKSSDPLRKINPRALQSLERPWLPMTELRSSQKFGSRFYVMGSIHGWGRSHVTYVLRGCFDSSFDRQ